MNRDPNDMALLSTYHKHHFNLHSNYAKPRFGQESFIISELLCQNYIYFYIYCIIFYAFIYYTTIVIYLLLNLYVFNLYRTLCWRCGIFY